jgi:hypothetical protein
VVALALVLAWAAGWAPAETARLADGTPLQVRLKADLVSESAAVGNRVDLEVSRPVVLQGVVVIPDGSVAWGAVQLVKKGKALWFDVEGVRLPNLKEVKLRCSPQRTTNVSRDEIKVETQVGSDVGAAKGSEFTAYLDQDVTVDLMGAPAAPPAAAAAPAAAPKPAPVAAPAPTPKPPAGAPRAAETHPSTPAPVAAPPVAPAPPVTPTVEAQPGEYITVECFSDPLGADILIDGEFHGNTPSILKILPGNHQLEYQLFGYKGHTENLNLTPDTGVRTVRVTLEKKE